VGLTPGVHGWLDVWKYATLTECRGKPIRPTP
jgi:hypothetical protein